MAKHLSISTGDPNEITQAFTSYWFLDYWTINERDQVVEAYWGVYRAVSGNERAGSIVAERFLIKAADTNQADSDGNVLQVLFSDWQDGAGLVTRDTIYNNVKTLTVLWLGNGESVDLSTATELP